MAAGALLSGSAVFETDVTATLRSSSRVSFLREWAVFGSAASAVVAEANPTVIAVILASTVKRACEVRIAAMRLRSQCLRTVARACGMGCEPGPQPGVRAVCARVIRA